MDIGLLLWAWAAHVQPTDLLEPQSSVSQRLTLSGAYSVIYIIDIWLSGCDWCGLPLTSDRLGPGLEFTPGSAVIQQASDITSLPTPTNGKVVGRDHWRGGGGFKSGLCNPLHTGSRLCVCEGNSSYIIYPSIFKSIFLYSFPVTLLPLPELE